MGILGDVVYMQNKIIHNTIRIKPKDVEKKDEKLLIPS